MVLRAKHIIKWSIWIAVIYFSQYWIYFFSEDVDHSEVVINVIGLVLVALFTFVFGYGIISLIYDFRSGGWLAIKDKIKMLFRGK